MRVLVSSTLALTCAILCVLGAGAKASGTNPPPFMEITGKTSQPIGHYEFCQIYASECAVKSKSEIRVTLTPERWNTLVEVDNQVNTAITPTTDMKLFGRPEVWFYPTTEGDCEDFVLLKRRDLIEKGWPAGALLVTVVRQKNGDGHAVLTVVTNRGDLVLDNLNGHILVWNQTDYQYVKRQSQLDTGGWVAIDDARMPLVGSVH
jgi:predicted transglutaminase-like cysteine proteinase